MPRYRYTRELLEAMVRESISISDVMRKLGLRFSGGGHAHIRRRIQAFGIDTSHFLGVRANSGGRHRGGPVKKRREEMLTLREPTATVINIEKVRRALAEMGRPLQCEVCGPGPEWNGRPLVLQVDHVNGRHHDYRPENLRFICPNCHSQTVNFSSRNKAYAEVAERQTPTA